MCSTVESRHGAGLERGKFGRANTFPRTLPIKLVAQRDSVVVVVVCEERAFCSRDPSESRHIGMSCT